MLTYCNGPKVGIKLLKVSHVIILFLVSLLFVAVINPYSVFKFLIIYCMARNFQGTKFLRTSSRKHFAKNFKVELIIKPTITIHTFYRSRGMAGSDIHTSFEVESMVRGYHYYNIIWSAVIGATCRKYNINLFIILQREGMITCRVTGTR